MGRLRGALTELHRIDETAKRDWWLNRIHPLVKLVVTIGYIAVTVSFPNYRLPGILSMGVYPVAIFILGDIPIKDSLRRLRVALPVVCFIGIFHPLLDRRPLGTLGGVTITLGMVAMVALMVKGAYAVLASYLLIASTSIEEICYAMRLLHIPSILVTQILLTYRYINVLLDEADRMMQAYSLRAPGQKGVHFKVWGSLAGQLLLKSMDRAKEVYDSMLLRGYQGEFYDAAKEPCHIKDYMYLAVWCVLFFVLRICSLASVS
ncbi:cobalt ECF transporter T component CbiQ [Lachnospiraceae bacterium 29-84]